MISIGLNLILGIMLFCALVLGLRLEKRLRGLRQAHADFAKAVSELDQAAVRTEDSLAKLRAGTETARSELAARIDQARIACQRLEKLTGDADRLLAEPLLLSRPAPAPVGQAPVQRMAPTAAAPRPAAPTPAARSRALVDDDLFAAPEPPRRAALAAVMGGRR